MTRPLFAVLAACLFLLPPAARAAEENPMLQHSRLYRATPAQLWDVWTTPEGFRGVFGDGRDLRTTMTVGGPYEILWSDEAPEGQRGGEGCTLLTAEPERVLSFTWNAPPEFGPLRDQHTRVVIRLTPVGPDTTRLTLTHLGFGAGDEWARVRAYFDTAWPWVLDQIAGVYPLGDAPPGGWLVLLNPARPGFWETGPTPEEQAVIQDHFVRLKELERERVLVFAGPSTDTLGPGVVILEAADRAEAERLMNEDPAVRAGVFTAQLHPIGFSLVRGRDLD